VSPDPRASPGRVFDGHNDLLYELAYAGAEWFAGGRDAGHIDLPRLRAADLAAGLFAVFARDPEWRSEWWEPVPTAGGGYRIADLPAISPSVATAEAFAQIDIGWSLLQDYPEDLVLLTTREHLDASLADPRVGIVLHLEGADPIGGDLGELEHFHTAGVRSLGLAWSRPNRFAHGVPFRFPSSPDTGPGLTADGARLVARCQELGIVVDLAHLNERSFWDVAAICEAPLVVSHAAAHALCPSSRNLTDAQLDRIGASGGLVGVNFNVRDLRPDGREDPDTPLELIAEHIEYIASRIGIGHVAFGSDLDGATMPAAFGDVTGFGALLNCLRRRGHDEQAIDKLAHGNWLRVLGATFR
jgi:membrane dipeptidase